MVEPAEHRKLDTGIKINLPEDFIQILSEMTLNIEYKIENCKKIQNKKCLILNFLSTFFVKIYSIDRNDLVGILVIIHKNNKTFKIKHQCIQTEKKKKN